MFQAPYEAVAIETDAQYAFYELRDAEGRTICELRLSGKQTVDVAGGIADALSFVGRLLRVTEDLGIGGGEPVLGADAVDALNELRVEALVATSYF